MDASTLLLLAVAGMSAGFIDAIAGGGGLISMPALLWAGLPPQLALGTNKLQSSFGTIVAVRRYATAGLVDWRRMTVPVAVTFISAALGTVTVTLVSNAVLKKIVPWMLLGVAGYTLASPRLGSHERHARLAPLPFALICGSAIGFYDGFFGPGTGSFWTIACITLAGLELTKATAFTKVVNLASNIAALIAFALAARIRYDVGAVMICGQLAGARLGAGLVVRHGAPLIRVVFLAAVLAMVAKLLWDQWHHG
ncbi:MAG: TSUP family transporter [Verrucomicrobiaceae bacterium]|nr:TSUP family transporter [Verrucomicrobiaceae bacterium]